MIGLISDPECKKHQATESGFNVLPTPAPRDAYPITQAHRLVSLPVYYSNIFQLLRLS